MSHRAGFAPRSVKYSTPGPKAGPRPSLATTGKRKSKLTPFTFSPSPRTLAMLNPQSGRNSSHYSKAARAQDALRLGRLDLAHQLAKQACQEAGVAGDLQTQANGLTLLAHCDGLMSRFRASQETTHRGAMPAHTVRDVDSPCPTTPVQTGGADPHASICEATLTIVFWPHTFPYSACRWPELLFRTRPVPEPVWRCEHRPAAIVQNAVQMTGHWAKRTSSLPS